MSNMHVDDIGTIIQVIVEEENSVVDISTATTKEILLHKPDGSMVTKTASFTTDGTDGAIKYATLTGDLNLAGKWQVEGHIVMPTRSFYTDVVDITVDAHIT